MYSMGAELTYPHDRTAYPLKWELLLLVNCMFIAPSNIPSVNTHTNHMIIDRSYQKDFIYLTIIIGQTIRLLNKLAIDMQIHISLECYNEPTIM